MLLKTLTAINRQGSQLSLPLDDISGGFMVKGIEGLGPVKATLVSSSFANLDGEQFHSSRREIRNIVIKLGLEPDYAASSVSELRTELYNFFMPKSRVRLQFSLFDKYETSILEQNLDLEIIGRVETCEPDIFSSDPALDVSILCYTPEFVDPEIVTFNGVTTNELDEDVVEYGGTIETGIEFKIFPDRAMDDFTIYHRQPDGTLHTMYYTSSLDANDELTINTSIGGKHVTLKRGSVESSRLFSLSPQSAWLELRPGESYFRVYATGDPVPYSFSYTNKYGGL